MMKPHTYQKKFRPGEGYQKWKQDGFPLNNIPSGISYAVARAVRRASKSIPDENNQSTPTEL